ncbi:hypothetical protein KFL_003230010 [Klebsormidium nitens]|uniref:Tic22-like family protein n=1 Tax=Klebsormidium nitens TaxID=105231 RepID=A0A1Y1IE26_KLENI|nr:hypothetical protein KFL_003230010 [Klebsormidium nitens]|eukprot:GAQ86956.1 hypothetical protein KFL_003230010 [Klebsormidium nitens]
MAFPDRSGNEAACSTSAQGTLLQNLSFVSLLPDPRARRKEVYAIPRVASLSLSADGRLGSVQDVVGSCRKWQHQMGQNLRAWSNGLLKEDSVQRTFNFLNRRSSSLASLSTSWQSETVPYEPREVFKLAMTEAQITSKLDSVPVYTVINADNEFVLVSGGEEDKPDDTKHLGLFCFSEKDAAAFLKQVKDRDPALFRNARVAAVSLEKVYTLSSQGIAFRFLPDIAQVAKAIKVKEEALNSSNPLGSVPGKGDKPKKEFDGVPVFQSHHLALRAGNKRYCPIFFRYEDVEAALKKAKSREERTSKKMINQDHSIQVGSFEDCLRRLERADINSEWGDVVFIPPGDDMLERLDATAQAGSKTVIT